MANDLDLDTSQSLVPAARQFGRANARTAERLRLLQEEGQAGAAPTLTDKLGPILGLLSLAAEATSPGGRAKQFRAARIPGQVAEFTTGRREARQGRLTESRQRVADRIALEEMLGGARGRSFSALSTAVSEENRARASRAGTAIAREQLGETKKRTEIAQAGAKQEKVIFDRSEAEYKDMIAARPDADAIMARGGPQNLDEYNRYLKAYPNSKLEFKDSATKVREWRGDMEKAVKPQMDAFLRYLGSEEGALMIEPQQLPNGSVETPLAARIRVEKAYRDQLTSGYIRSAAASGDPLATMAVMELQQQQAEQAQRERFERITGGLAPSHEVTAPEEEQNFLEQYLDYAKGVWGFGEEGEQRQQEAATNRQALMDWISGIAGDAGEVISGFDLSRQGRGRGANVGTGRRLRDSRPDDSLSVLRDVPVR